MQRMKEREEKERKEKLDDEMIWMYWMLQSWDEEEEKRMKKKSFSIALLSFFLFIEIEEQSSKSKSLVQSNIQIFNNHLWSIMIMTWTWTMLKKWCSRLHAIETTNDLAFEGYLKEYDVYQIFKLLMNFEYKKRKRWPRYLAYLNKTINSSFFFFFLVNFTACMTKAKMLW